MHVNYRESLSRLILNSRVQLRVNVNLMETSYQFRPLGLLMFSDVVIGGITMRPSNAFPRSDRDDPIIFNCTTTSTLFPWWTFNNEIFGNVTVTNSTCGVITSLRYNFWLKSETFGPGSCNLISILPAHILNSFAGSLVCTDSTLSSARAIVIPISE